MTETETATATIEEQARRVLELRDEERKEGEVIRALQAAFEQSIRPKMDGLAQVRGLREEAETQLRTLALAEYARTGNKQPGPGVAIRITTRLEYEQAAALAWANEHSLALQLDRRAFEAIAKTAPPPFVTTISEPQATIATDLAAVLGARDGGAS